MSWIATVAYEEAEGRLRHVYERVRGPDGKIDNILRAHSLRPHTLEGHMALYKSVLHHPRNQIDRWLLEAIGSYVSLLNGCDYCVEHHLAGMARLLADDARSAEIRAALEAGTPEDAFEGRELAMMRYAERLTRAPEAMAEDDVAALRQAGLDDGEILEVNQLVAYFAYANRTVLGLGVTSKGDVLGLSPSNRADSDDWSHI
ncbi:MAG: peroxidase-related enzyme [Pseudomonadota bacterium]